MGPTTQNWSQFLNLRKEGPVTGQDPEWKEDRLPDVIIFTLGYHFSGLSVKDFGKKVEGIFSTFDAQMETIKSSGETLPLLHYMLNIMPAPDLIPASHRDDIPHRTFINEYRKNEAVLNAALNSKHIQIIDFMSIELPFNDKGDHRDAVHLGSSRVKDLLSDAVLIALCNVNSSGTALQSLGNISCQ